MPDLMPLVIKRLREGIGRVDEAFARRWEPCSAESFQVVATPEGNRGPDARWRVYLASRAIAPANGYRQPASAANGHGDDGGESAQDETDWDIIGSAAVWEQVMTGRVNLSVALRRNELRYCEEAEAGPVVAAMRTAMLADLLGLACWGQAHPGANRVRAVGKAGQ